MFRSSRVLLSLSASPRAALPSIPNPLKDKSNALRKMLACNTEQQHGICRDTKDKHIKTQD